MIPATIACSFAFMLPSATGPNAVVFASGEVSIPRMAATGFILNLIAVVMLTAFMYLIAVPMFGLSGGTPPWAQ
jgi:sodium-dependent dicarboxylate transporter 2/3/5